MMVKTQEINRWLLNVRNLLDDLLEIAGDKLTSDEYEIVYELYTQAYNTIVTVEQQLTERDKLIKELQSAALDLTICLDEYQQATHNYDMSDEDRHIYDDIDAAQDKLDDLGKRIKEVTGE